MKMKGHCSKPCSKGHTQCTLSMTCGSAPLSISNCTSASWPFRQACMSGVLPSYIYIYMQYLHKDDDMEYSCKLYSTISKRDFQVCQKWPRKPNVHVDMHSLQGIMCLELWCNIHEREQLFHWQKLIGGVC